MWTEPESPEQVEPCSPLQAKASALSGLTLDLYSRPSPDPHLSLSSDPHSRLSLDLWANLGHLLGFSGLGGSGAERSPQVRAPPTNPVRPSPAMTQKSRLMSEGWPLPVLSA